MEIKEIESSVLNVRIILILLDGKTKTAFDMVKENNEKYRMENKYREKCNNLSSKGVLHKYPLEKRKGYAYSLNFDVVIKHFGERAQKYKREDIIEFLKGHTISKEVKMMLPKVKRGHYKYIINSFYNLFLAYSYRKLLEKAVPYFIIKELMNIKNSLNKGEKPKKKKSK